ncbi:sugar transferase [Nocardia brasiliensis]|uniref:sugar transferase n=1 Tax=Nocardia brasiliensis TaxID=37326 RepID=UPI003D9481C7
MIVTSVGLVIAVSSESIASTAGMTVLLVMSWLFFLAIGRSPAKTAMDEGEAEYLDVVRATFRTFMVVVLAGLIVHTEIRTYVISTLALGLAGILACRFVRRYRTRRRLPAAVPVRVLVVGGPAAAHDTAAAFADHRGHFCVVGACLPRESARESISVGHIDIPVVSDDRSILRAAHSVDAHVVAVTTTNDLGPRELRDLAWNLHEVGIELVLNPGVSGVVTTRLGRQRIARTTMWHIRKARYEAATRIPKAMFDIAASSAILLLLTPTLLVIGVLVKYTSPGPVFYRSERIGLNGRPFQMIKFRSMYHGADQRTAELIAGAGGNPLFFKLRDDPRVTPVGKVLRKYSLDELPQFLNVLHGDMSIVGPRPQVRREVETYDSAMSRRLLVKPGITGQWQVSGRSELSVAESFEHDIWYVENWSMALDLTIIMRTIGVVVRGQGAY